MTQKDTEVRIGNISTYEDASEDFLRRRKEDLRTQIRNPVLNTGEFVREVATRFFITAVAAGLSVWTGLERVLKNPRMNLRLGSNVYVYDDAGYETRVKTIGRYIADAVHAGPKVRPGTAQEIVNKAIDMGEALNLRSGMDELKAFQTNVLNKNGISESEKCQKLFETLSKVYKKNNGSGIGQLSHLWEELITISKESYKHTSASGVMQEAWSRTHVKIMNNAVYNDNKRIMNFYRVPATAALATMAGLFTGYQAWRFARRQKALDQESEISHIERLEDERSKRPQTEVAEKPKQSHVDQVLAARETARAQEAAVSV